MFKLESVQENETQKIQTDHPILARKLDLVLINKKIRTCHLMDFTIPMD